VNSWSSLDGSSPSLAADAAVDCIVEDAAGVAAAVAAVAAVGAVVVTAVAVDVDDAIAADVEGVAGVDADDNVEMSLAPSSSDSESCSP
jgi:hypothetical protein